MSIDTYEDVQQTYDKLLYGAQKPVRQAIKELGHSDEEADRLLDRMNHWYGPTHMLFLQRLLSCQPGELE
jgi:hypothetical protein